MPPGRVTLVVLVTIAGAVVIGFKQVARRLAPDAFGCCATAVLAFTRHARWRRQFIGINRKHHGIVRTVLLFHRARCLPSAVKSTNRRSDWVSCGAPERMLLQVIAC